MDHTIKQSEQEMVLIIGFGKIGRIKSSLWKELGFRVTIADTNPAHEKEALILGYEFTDDFSCLETQLSILDISTPAGTHFDVLKDALNQLQFLPETIIVEKPFASSQEELENFLALLKDPVYPRLADCLFINEQYYSSSTLKRVYELLDNEHIESIAVDLSKNRITDTKEAGRFFDYTLGAFGIELPHALAVLDVLGIDVASLKNSVSVRYIESTDPLNQAAFVSGEVQNSRILLSSHLGSFSVANDNEIVVENSLTRKIVIHTSTRLFDITLDPHPSLARFFAHIQVSSKDGAMLIDEVVFDDHLKAHLSALSQISPSKEKERSKLLAMKHHIKLLVKFSKDAEVKKVIMGGNIDKEFNYANLS